MGGFALCFSFECQAGRKKVQSKSGYTQKQIKAFNDYTSKYKERYKAIGESAKQLGYTLRDIGLPKSTPPDVRFSKILHSLITSYTNLAHQWVQGCEDSKHLSPDRKWRIASGSDTSWKPDENFSRFLEISDPLLRPSLAHLLFLAHSGVVAVSSDELNYVDLRMRWVKETILPEGVHGFDCEKDYKELKVQSGSWPEPEVAIPKAETTEILRGVLALEPYSIANELAMEHLTDQNFDNSLCMGTVWEAWFKFGETGMGETGAKVPDVFLEKHVGFVLKALRQLPELDFGKRVLGVSWLQQTAIEKGKAASDQQLRWSQLIGDYVLPEIPGHLQDQDSSEGDPFVPPVKRSRKDDSLNSITLDSLVKVPECDEARNQPLSPTSVNTARRGSSLSGGAYTCIRRYGSLPCITFACRSDYDWSGSSSSLYGKPITFNASFSQHKKH